MSKPAGDGSIEHSSSLLNLMKQRGISDHPLAEKSYEDLDAEETSSYTESLLQSAVKSVMDTSTSAVSDDEDSVDSGRPRSPLISPTLRSLQTKTIPAFPAEDDRKRFVGCLAAILASAYDYDVSGEDDAAAEHSMAYLDVHGDEDKEDEYLSERDVDADLVSCYSTSHDFGELDTNEHEHKSLLTSLASETMRPSHSQELLNGSSRSASASTTPTQSVHGTGGAPRSQSSMHELWNRRDANRDKRALQRHRRRRYEVLTDILVKSAELLLLDPAQSRAFVPMLSKLLLPPKTSDKKKAADRRKSDSEETKSEFDDKLLIIRELDEDDVLRPFLESLTPGSGFRCLSLLLLQHLLRSAEGYDARIRHVLKKLGTIIFVHEMERDSENLGPEDREWNRRVLLRRATRKYESLEHTVAVRILELSAVGQDLAKRKGGVRSPNGRFKVTLSRDHVVRGLKIGGAGLVAGGLMAITGGLAAPAIAAGMAALAGGTASAALVALTSTAAVTSIFGVGGAGLVAYKMQRRTKGLTEFEFQKESSMMRREDGRAESAPIEAELFTTICISGWLRDYCDFQRPWGTTPTNPRINDGLELLERFYAVHKPDHVPKSQHILNKWAGEERHLWKLLKEKYGCNPDHLFPLEDGPRYRALLSLDQKEVIANLFVELGYAAPPSEQHGPPTPFEKMRNGFRGRFRKPQAEKKDGLERLDFADLIDEVQNAPFEGAFPLSSQTNAPNPSATTEGSMPQNLSANNEGAAVGKPNGVLEPPLHLTTVWDYQAHYGGELYTVKWESHLLMELCNSVEDMAMDIVSNATQHILKATIFAALVTSVALPIAIVKTANMIDGTWTIAIERADLAGKELAKSLLFSRAGQRPITLVGYSMGARTIYSCLKELSKYQEIWEDERERKTASEGSKNDFKPNPELENMREPASIVEDVILMGTPNHLSVRSWKACRQIVSGRLVNCYSRKDLILSLMFQYKRLSSAFKKVCGTCAIDIPGVENVDVTDLVTGHHLYCIATGDILKRVGHGQAVRGPRNLELQEDETKTDQLSDAIPDVKIHYR
jgi:Protein of unknown function (DUF726)